VRSLILVTVNDEAREVAENLTLEELVKCLSLPGDRLAIELNRSVVRRLDWPVTRLEENDRLEIVHFVGGG
jgi:sulfur carrier protein